MVDDSVQPEKLVHLFDELAETLPGVPTAEYKKYLIKWGVDNKTASRVCTVVDPHGTGRVTRDALCEGLKCWPNQPAILNQVKILESDMSVMKRESVILMILEIALQNKPMQDTIEKIKDQLKSIYGPGWSVSIAKGEFWCVCSHQRGSNLAFKYNDYVYCVYQTSVK